MVEWEIADQDIESTEELLLPDGARFSEDARDVIRCWHSTDVEACPGSGKTTVLLAKLKLLADRMPLENGAGICVLSHTNVAVDEIKKRLSAYADRLLGYPNYTGTIQSFVDKFVAIPYLRTHTGRNVQTVDDDTYAQHMLSRMQKNVEYYKDLFSKVNQIINTGNQFKNQIELIKSLYLGDDDSLYVGKQKSPIAGVKKKTAVQYNKLIESLLKDEGIIKYRDAYKYAEEAIAQSPEVYKALFSSRFRYVFIDEYQDCNIVQRKLIDMLFDPTKCTVIQIGDSDQAIYDFIGNDTPDWIPRDGALRIMTSCRYSQEIADVICNLKKGDKNITTFAGNTGLRPVLIVFSSESIGRVIGTFINVLETHGLCEPEGIYKAIGAYKKEGLKGLTIGSYWPKFDNSLKKQNEYNYSAIVDDIIQNLSEGKLYQVEHTIRKLIYRIFHYAHVRNEKTGKEFSLGTIKAHLDDEYWEIYRQWIYEMSRLWNPEKEIIDRLVRQKINELFRIETSRTDDAFDSLPAFFLDVVAAIKHTEKNVITEPIRGRRIEVSTIHGVKGETHDATLYLETEWNRASDLSRILSHYGVGNPCSQNTFNQSRKLAYVGMSRPRKLLCVALQSKTYENSKHLFSDGWEIIDIRTIH